MVHPRYSFQNNVLKAEGHATLDLSGSVSVKNASGGERYAVSNNFGH